MLKTMFKSMIRTPAFRRALSWVLAAVSGVCIVLAILGRPLPLSRIFGTADYFLPLILWHILLTYFPSTPRRQRLDRISTWCLIVSIVLMVIIGVVYIRYSTPQWINMESVLSLFFIPRSCSSSTAGVSCPGMTRNKNNKTGRLSGGLFFIKLRRRTGRGWPGRPGRPPAGPPAQTP